MSESSFLDGLKTLWGAVSPQTRVWILQQLTERTENKFYKLMKIETPADLRKALLKHD